VLHNEEHTRFSECQVELLEIHVFNDVTLWQQVQMYQCFRGSHFLQHISKCSTVSTAWHPTSLQNFII